MEIWASPILRSEITHYTGSDSLQFREPVTIQLPLSLRKESCKAPGDMSSCRVCIWFLESASDREKWTDITDRLFPPASFNRMAIEFSVMPFSGPFSGYVTFVTVIQSAIIWPCTQIVLFGNYLHDAAWAMVSSDSVHTSLQCLYPSRVDIQKLIIQNVFANLKELMWPYP